MLLLLVAACSPNQPSADNAAVNSSSAAAAVDPFASGAQCFASVAGDAGIVVAEPYPDYFRAEFPPYPNAKATPCYRGTYEFRTGDDPATVLAWYKAHAKARWSQETTPNGFHLWVGSGDGAYISIGPPPGLASNFKTVIDVEPLMRLRRPAPPNPEKAA
jgi:hypothetical protein